MRNQARTIGLLVVALAALISRDSPRPPPAHQGWLTLRDGAADLPLTAPPAKARFPALAARIQQRAQRRTRATADFLRHPSEENTRALARGFFPELASRVRPDAILGMPSGAALEVHRADDGSLAVTTRGLTFTVRSLASPIPPSRSELDALYLDPRHFWAPTGQTRPLAGGGWRTARVDEYWVMTRASGVQRARYELALPSGVSTLHDAGDYLELLGPEGRPVLRFHPAIARDANGTTRKGSLRIKGARPAGGGRFLLSGHLLALETTVSLEGLAAPLVVDPGFSSTGALAEARSAPGCSLLPDGRVLVAGGDQGAALGSSELFDPRTATWSATGALPLPRTRLSTVLLGDGKVLGVGGSSFQADGDGFATTVLYDPATGTWSDTGSLNAHRGWGTATLLADGRVLVAGGTNSSDGDLDTAELYDPSTGVWSKTGQMKTVRVGHTATLLPDGRVLVAGGTDGFTELATAELFDPATGVWSPAGSPAIARKDASATLLRDGRVLLTAGESASGPVTQSELYDPSSDTWALTGSITVERINGAQTLLPNGTVLLTGGYDTTPGSIDDSEIYDPTTGAWTVVDPLAQARDAAAVTLLPSGQVLVAAGFGSQDLSSAEIYEPELGAWSSTGDLGTARDRASATLLPDGSLLAAGGESGPSVPLASAERYDPVSGTWTGTGALGTARSSASGIPLPDGSVLIAGGHDSASTVTPTAERYDPSSGTWSATGPLATARAAAAGILLLDGRVLIAGGEDGASAPISGAELYDPSSGSWSPTGAMATARAFASAARLPDGRVLVAGGTGTAGALASAELYDPATGTWSPTGSLAQVRRLATAAVLPDGRVLVAGGLGASSPLKSAEVFDPASGSWSSTASLATAREEASAVVLPSGQVLVAGGHNGSGWVGTAERFTPATGRWTPAGSLAGPRGNATLSLLPSGLVLIAGGENASGATNTAERFDPTGADPAWRPVIAAVSSLVGGKSATVSGSGLRGSSDATGGSFLSSPARLPQVVLQALDDGRLTAISGSDFTDSSLTLGAVPNLPSGDYLLFVSPGGIPGGKVVALTFNQPPVANPASATVPEDGSLGVTLTGSDPEGDPLSFKVMAYPLHGSLTGTPPNLTYTPAPDFNGSDSFRFRANDGTSNSARVTFSITVTPVNDAPVAQDGSVTTDEDTGIDIPLAASDVDGDLLSDSVVTSPAHGTLTLSGTTAHYEPSADFNGSDSFTFQASDGIASSNVATVSITVSPVNDAPVAADRSATTAEDTSTAITLGASDRDGDSLSYSVTAGPAHGTLSGTPPNLSYAPAANFNGSDSFTFRASDGSASSNIATVSISVTAVNDAPAAQATSVTTNEDTSVGVTLTANDVDGDSLSYAIVTLPAHGSLSGTAPNLSYTPAANFHGSDALTFRAMDGSGLSSTATVSITVQAINDAPVAVAGSATGEEDTAIAIPLQASDVDGDTLAYSVVTPPVHGTVQLSGATATYTPAANFSGSDGFTFRAADGALSSTATVTLTVNPVNDAPAAVAATASTPQETVLRLTLQATDVDGDALSYSVVTGPAHGTLQLSGRTATYTPATGYLGTDGFSFRANDGTLDSNVATVSITVSAPNHAPAAQDGSASTDEDKVVAIPLQATDADGDALTFALAQSPAHGTVTLSGSTATYAPAAHFTGTDQFTFTASDGSLTSTPATLRITVQASQPPPVPPTAGGCSSAGTGAGPIPGLALLGMLLAFAGRRRRQASQLESRSRIF